MVLLIIADDELVEQRVPDCPADLLISCGNMPEEIILALAERCHCHEILAVKGHHDSGRPFCRLIRDLHLDTFKYRGITFGGFCGAWKYQPVGDYLFTQPEVEQHLAKFPAVDVFIACNSPRLIHDRDDEMHMGFVSFNNYIARTRPKLFLHGHHHETVESFAGPTRILGTHGHRFFVLPE